MLQSSEKLYKQRVDYYFRSFLLVYWLIILGLLLYLLFYSNLDYASLFLMIYLAVIGWFCSSEMFIDYKMRKYPEYEEYKLNIRKKKKELRLKKEIRRIKKSYRYNI
jgi:hypothetical protein